MNSKEKTNNAYMNESAHINKREIGTQYEKRAVQFLQDKGYTIIERNYRCHKGEIDIIAREPVSAQNSTVTGLESQPNIGTIVFIEVKYRINNLKGDPAEAVDKRKCRTISRVAEYFLTETYHTTDIACRFDVISILDDEIIHYENAFDYTP